jgi:hypothetical protein
VTTRDYRSLVQLCARCGGWLSISGTYASRPFEVVTDVDDEPEIIVLRLPWDRDLGHYSEDRGCGCAAPPAPRPTLMLEEDEFEDRQHERIVAERAAATAAGRPPVDFP